MEKRVITLKTLPEATAQEVFNQAKNHLLKQKVKSARKEGGLDYCLYRGPEGLKCAGGCFIAEDEYRPGMENQPWNSHWFPIEHRKLIQELQWAHDSNDPNVWPAKLKCIAAKFNLKYS